MVLLRKIANHAFHGESLKIMIPMLERWKSHEGEEIEVEKKTALGVTFLDYF